MFLTTPSAPQRNGTIFLLAQPPLLWRRGVRTSFCIPLLQRRGGRGINKMVRSHLGRRGRGGQIYYWHMPDDPFLSWFEAVERRHLSDLTFQEVRRAVQALSSSYVERREKLATGDPLSGAGKRAAFGMFFAPLHFLLVREIVRNLKARLPKGTSILDLGCGTGVAGAAWALEANSCPKVLGVDQNTRVLQECKWNYSQLGINGVTKCADLEIFRMPRESAIIAAFTLNELSSGVRERYLQQFFKLSQAGFPILVIEPIARRLVRWWDDWTEAWTAAGGRADNWRFRIDLPERLALMDRAAGLDHRELTGRSLWLPGSA